MGESSATALPERPEQTGIVSTNIDSALAAGIQDLTLIPQGTSPTLLSASVTSSTMSSSESPAPESWISSFCSLLGHEYFAEVSEDFIEDDFNLTGLQSQVPMYKEALEMILDVEPEEDDEEEDEEEEEDDDEDDGMRDENGEKLDTGYRRGAGDRRHMRMASDLSVIESSAELLYGLIHQRYITSRPGIQQMAEKYDLQHFGACPRVFCNSAKVLPVGCHDTPGIDTVKLFCPSCLDVYTPPNSRFQSVDGAFFGTTFGCLFFMTFPEFEVSSKGDPLKLASTHPIFANINNHAPLTTPSETTNNKSRSSSLTSNHQAPAVSPPPEFLPPPNQPAIINGAAPANLAPGLGPGKIYEPRIYGFRVNERAKTGPRMKWLRMRPLDVNELDEGRKWYAVHGGDGEDDVQGAGGGGSGKGVVERRKKAPIRTRRRGGGSGLGGGGGGGGAGGGEVTVGSNGVGEGV